MASMEDKIREYRTRASQKQAVRARAQAELDAAEERVSQTRERLREEFGVSTPEEAKAFQQSLQEELNAKQAEIETALAEAGA